MAGRHDDVGPSDERGRAEAPVVAGDEARGARRDREAPVGRILRGREPGERQTVVAADDPGLRRGGEDEPGQCEP
jgi:hypothetical protein